MARSLLKRVSLEFALLQLQARPDNNAGCQLAVDVMWSELAVADSCLQTSGHGQVRK